MLCARTARTALAVLTTLLLASSATALTIDFEGQPNGEAGPFQYVFPGVTVDVTADTPPPGDHEGLAIFDSDTGGPNDGLADQDLVVDHGNILILQNGSGSYPTQTVPGIFDVANDDEDGGIFYFDFSTSVLLSSIELIDINGMGMLDVILRDSAGETRTYAVPDQWTGDITQPGQVGFQVLDLTTLADQLGVGPGGLATASQTALFDPSDVVQLEVSFGGSAAVDNLVFVPEPTTALLLGLGLGVMGWRSRRS